MKGSTGCPALDIVAKETSFGHIALPACVVHQCESESTQKSGI